ncbi:hypothetical protein UY3_16772 [Chelonia mydas]|uniref:Uncharacterized protein n=1 Tax=Chelonia mydas TaxID=8469 RepID=M7B219_CHEMY|nr:hypothetical protein UY3_16772 [Chelonia mydas]
MEGALGADLARIFRGSSKGLRALNSPWQELVVGKANTLQDWALTLEGLIEGTSRNIRATSVVETLTEGAEPAGHFWGATWSTVPERTGRLPLHCTADREPPECFYKPLHFGFTDMNLGVQPPSLLSSAEWLRTVMSCQKLKNWFLQSLRVFSGTEGPAAEVLPKTQSE